MSEKGFVYTGLISEESLKLLLEQLKVTVNFSWSLTEIKAGEGMPDNLLEFGMAFNKCCEVRWQKVSEKCFQVLVLSDKPQDELPLSPVHGEWEVESLETKLRNLREAAINPPFDLYPILKGAEGKLKCRVFYQNGVAMFISPREVLKDEKPTQ